MAINREIKYNPPSVTIHKFTLESGEILSFKKPIVLDIVLNEDNLYVIENEELDINVYGFTIDDVVDMLNSEIEHLWTEYAMEDDSKLTKKAMILKRKWLSMVGNEDTVSLHMR